FDQIAESNMPLDPDGTPGSPNTASYNQLTRTSDGIGSLAGDSGATPPALVFVEDSVALKGSDITSYTWGATNPDVFHASLQDFTITLTPGIAEPGLWGRLAVGKHLKTATIQLSKVSALGKPHVYTTYTVTNVTISSFTTSEQGGAVPQDTIGLHFDQIAESYIPLDPDGTPGSPNTASYNQLTRTSDGIGSLAGDSGATPPALVFVEDSVALKGSDITSYTWGATNPDVFHASLQDFTITLPPGIAEPGLWGRLAVGKHLKTATIQLSKVSALGKPHVYTTYTLTNVTISSFTTSEQGGAAPQDTIGLHFDEIAESYIPLDPDGTPGSPNTASYNQLTRTSDGIGSLAGDSGATPPAALVFVEDSVALKGSDITSYTWGATNPDVFHASLQDFTITLTPGIAEPGLWGRLAVGKHLKTATIQLSKVSALGKPHVYTTYTLTNVTISSFTTSEQGGAVPQDTIGLHFDQIAESYIPLDP